MSMRANKIFVWGALAGIAVFYAPLAQGFGRAPERQGGISNPFYGFYAPIGGADNIVLRTKKGDRTVELELGGKNSEMTDFVMPMSPHFRDGSAPYSGLADSSALDERYRDRSPSMTDREITRGLAQATFDNAENRREIEGGLGLTPTEDSNPVGDHSYLGATDKVKQLYKLGRYEAALLELDELIRGYPMDPKLYEMRGTLLDRAGHNEMAVKSWNQALRLDPANQSLKRFVERKQQARRLASPAGGEP